MNDPFPDRASVPCVTLPSSRAVSEPAASTSASLASRPGAAIVNWTAVAATYASGCATGASLTAAIVTVTVAVFDTTEPSLARKVNESLPIAFSCGA